VKERAAFVLDPFTGRLSYKMVAGERIQIIEPIKYPDFGAPMAPYANRVTLDGHRFAISFAAGDFRDDPAFGYAVHCGAVDLDSMSIRADVFVYAVTKEKAAEVAPRAIGMTQHAAMTSRKKWYSKRKRRHAARRGRKRRMGCRRVPRMYLERAVDIGAVLMIRDGRWMDAIAEMVGR